MCRMLGKISMNMFCPQDEIITAPNSLKIQSYRRREIGERVIGPHQQGSGIAWFKDDLLQVRKTAESNMWDEDFEKHIKSLCINNMIAHVREASPGLKVDISCSHPFESICQNKTLAFCHNGGINSFIDDAKLKGITDSQIYLQKIIANLRSVSYESLAESLNSIFIGLKYSSANALLILSDRLYAWRKVNPRSPKINQLESIYTLYYRADSKSAIVSTEPLDVSSEWKALENDTLAEFKLGTEGIVSHISRALTLQKP